MKPSVRIQLSAMMFLEFAVWGAWYVTMASYLAEAPIRATGVQIGAAYGAVAIATMVSPFIVGLIADRFFAAQRFLGVLHFLGAALLYGATKIQDANAFFWVILAYSAAYMPTLALTNAIAFRQMDAPDQQFPLIRVFGTLGWIAINLLVGALGIAKTAEPFTIAAILSLIMGVYAFFLPHTPPKGAPTEGGNWQSALGLEALVLFKDRSFLIFFVCSILVCIPLSFYYSFTNPFLGAVGMDNPTAKMTLGQVSEVGFMVLLPLVYNKLGIRNILIIALLAWMLRFLCFAHGTGHDATVVLLYLGILLHGVCFDFFFASGMIYTETKAGDGIKNAAQGLITFATYGVGMFIGTNLSGIVRDAFPDWHAFWLVPTGITAAVLVFLLLFFKEKKAV